MTTRDAGQLDAIRNRLQQCRAHIALITVEDDNAEHHRQIILDDLADLIAGIEVKTKEKTN